MKQGAIAMIDALGFRGVWRRPDVQASEEAFLQGLRDLKTTAKTEAEKISSGRGPIPTTSVTFLSDKIVVAVEAAITMHERSRDQAALLNVAVAVAINSVAELLRVAARPPVRLSFRGCVTVGDFVVDEHVLMGPAVDEAASLQEVAQGAIVWLAPSALHVVDRTHGGPTEAQTSAMRWTVPLKKEGPIKTLVVSPFTKQSTLEERLEIRENILATFDPGMSRLDVTIKRQHTEALLEEAERGATK